MAGVRGLSREARSQIAKETLAIVERGSYEIGGQQVSFAAAQTEAIQKTKLWLPDDLAELVKKLGPVSAPFDTCFEVCNETVLSASQRLHRLSNVPVCALNFASAKNPGGGFRSGSQAQEESIARSSGLYNCIAPVHGYYHYHRKRFDPRGIYSDRVIYSEDVPVFRDDNGNLLEKWYPLSIATCPAVNASVVKPINQELIEQSMRTRLDKVLALAVHQKVENLVLGAWGCGVFRNDPSKVASYFADALLRGPFKGRFKRIVFAVLDHTEQESTINPFRTNFPSAAAGSSTT